MRLERSEPVQWAFKGLIWPPYKSLIACRSGSDASGWFSLPITPPAVPVS